MGYRWANDLKLTIVSLIPLQATPEDMARLWVAAPFAMKRQSQRIRKMRVALILVAAVCLLINFTPLATGKHISFTDGLGRLTGSVILLLVMWRATIRSAIYQANEVHKWAKETLRDPEMFLQYQANATAMAAPWIDIDARLLARAKRSIKDRFRP